MAKKPIVGTRRYYDRLFIKHGEKMYCPICDCRPCCEDCPLGFTSEWEIAALTEMLADSDPRPKRT